MYKCCAYNGCMKGRKRKKKISRSCNTFSGIKRVDGSFTCICPDNCLFVHFATEKSLNIYRESLYVCDIDWGKMNVENDSVPHRKNI